MGSSRYQLAATVIIGVAGALALPAAAETDADFSKYCRTTYPNSGPVTRAPSGAIAHYCNQGGTLQGIDLAKACELTTGSRVYRQSGDRVLCEDGPGPSQAASGEALAADDFVRYCRTKFPNSSYQHVPGNFLGQHTCRRVGGPVGFTLQPIDLADACRTLKGAGAYREESGRVICETGGVTQTAERRATGAGSPRPAEPGPAPGPGPRPADPGGTGSGDKDDAGGAKVAGKSGKDDKGQGGVFGLWEMRVGTLVGAKIRVMQSGDLLTGIIEEIPPATRPYFQKFTALEIGGVLFVGQVNGQAFSGKTPLGVGGLRHPPSAHPQVCGPAIAEYRSNQDKWPELRATISDNQFIGKMRGVALYFQQGACRPNAFLDYPPLVQGGWVKFELEKVEETCVVAEKTDAPPLGLTQLLEERRNQARSAARAQLGQARQ